MRVVVNGKPMDLSEASTVQELIDRLGLTAGSVVVERNGEPVPRTDFVAVRLNEGDRLEVVRAVPGG
jgi:sulfur carrier protein